jgi:hypothetical protein
MHTVLLAFWNEFGHYLPSNNYLASNNPSLHYSIRPTFYHCDKSSRTVFASPDNVLHPNNMGIPIRYATSFSATGYGIRSLSGDELGNIYGLHSRIRMGGITQTDVKHLVPVSLLDSVLFPLVRASPCTMSNNTILQPAIFATLPPETSTWLPALQVFLSHDWISSDLVTDKAVKRDDSDVPITLWDKRITFLFPNSKATVDWLQRRLHFLRSQALYKEFTSYLSLTYGKSWSSQLTLGRSLLRTNISASSKNRPRKGFFEQQKNQQGGFSPNFHAGLSPNFHALHRDAWVGADCIHKYCQSSWWQWTGGSTMYFWRWGSHSALARDGFPPFVKAPLPSYLVRAKRPKSDKLPLLAPKFKLILERGYVQPGPIQSFIDYFDVPKADYIRLVYNGTSCGLNASLWAPNFWLPTAKTALRSLDFDFYSVDMDMGDMFLNFPLHRDLQSFSGIDLTPLKESLGVNSSGPLHVHWTRCWMGAKPSPFYAVSY